MSFAWYGTSIHTPNLRKHIFCIGREREGGEEEEEEEEEEEAVKITTRCVTCCRCMRKKIEESKCFGD
jgi:hypothetical protein